jgi:hypothetical protein
MSRQAPKTEIRWHDLYAESKLVELAENASESPEEVPPDIPIENIYERVASLKALRAACNTDEGWTLQKESKGVRTLYKNLPSLSHVHSLRLDGEVDAPVFTLLALLHEVDMFHKWIPTYAFLGLEFAKLIAHPSPTELLVHLGVKVPWPFTNRYCFFHCDGIDCMDDPGGAQIGVIMNNLTNEAEYDIRDPGVKTNFHPPSGILLTPIRDGRTMVQIVVNLDPQIALVPDWLIDIAVRNLAYLILLQIRKAVEIVKSDPEYQKRMTDPNSDFYAHIKRRIRESLPAEIEFLPKQI